MQQVKVNLLHRSTDNELVASAVDVLLSRRHGIPFYEQKIWAEVIHLLLLHHTVHFEIEDRPRHHAIDKRFSPFDHVLLKLLFAGLLHILPPRGGQLFLPREH